MSLSNKEIMKALEEGQIVCEPLTYGNIRKASMDLTLGEYYYPTQKNTGVVPGIFNPFDKTDVTRYYGITPKRAMPARDYPSLAWYLHGTDLLGLEGIPPDHPVILIAGRSCILAHTHEFVGAKATLGTTSMRARSTWGRLNIEVCRCAGQGDPGFINRWTMEIQNNNDDAVPLPVGERISQIIFDPTGPVIEGAYGGEEDYISKYQQGVDIEEIIRNWTPEQMLPKAYQDKRVLPTPII